MRYSNISEDFGLVSFSLLRIKFVQVWEENLNNLDYFPYYAVQINPFISFLL